MTHVFQVRDTKPKNLIKGGSGDWEVIVGLEVHAQVASKSKLFSGASTTFGNEPNANVSLAKISHYRYIHSTI